MNERVRILLIDDDEDEYFLLNELVSGQTKGAPLSDYNLDWVSTYEAAVKAFSECQYDVYLVDFMLGAHSGLDLLRENAFLGCTAPIIVLTGQGNYEIDLAAMQLGAADYLEKEQLSLPLLERSIRYSIERGRNIAALQKQAREIDALQKATSSLLSTLDLSRLMGQILDSAREAIPAADRGWLHILEGTSGRFNHLGGMWFEDSRIHLVRKPEEHSPTLKAVCAGQSQLVGNIQEDPLLLSFLGNDRDQHSVRSAVIAPLQILQEIIGAISVSAPQASAFTENDLRLLTSFAATASAAIHNAILYTETQNLAIHDPLTGKLNRRMLFEYGQREVERFRRFGHRLSVLMFDVDNFKDINDTYGHSVGDEVLIRIADLCSKLIRNVDLLGRYGGDEFAIVLPESGLPTGREIADRIRTSIYKHPIQTNAGTVMATISVGVAQASPEITDFAGLLHKADLALYQSKQAGRNRTTMAK